MRRYPNTEPGENFGRVLAHIGDGDDYADPTVMERTLGDYLDPTRTGCLTDIVNRVSQVVGADVQEWRVDRLLRMVAGVEQSRQIIAAE